MAHKNKVGRRDLVLEKFHFEGTQRLFYIVVSIGIYEAIQLGIFFKKKTYVYMYVPECMCDTCMPEPSEATRVLGSPGREELPGPWLGATSVGVLLVPS